MKLFLIVMAFCVIDTPKTDTPVASKTSEREAAKELAAVQGKWIRTIQTEKGAITVVKEHRGNKSTVTFLDGNQNVLAAKRSEFRLERSGKVRIFTFFNNVTTAGPGKGQTDKTPKSYIYRISGDRFFEANGMLVDDDSEPVAFAWKRLKE